MATRDATEFQFEGPAAFEEEAKREHVAGIGPWRLAARRLKRNKVALGFGVLFLLLVGLALAAPSGRRSRAATRCRTTSRDTITVDGKETDVVSTEGVPIGPQWTKEYFLGADTNGRDVMVRLLYGGRNSLLIGISAALITTLLSIVLGILAGFFRGVVDAFVRPALDIIWAFPVILLGVALGTALALGGLKLGSAGDLRGIEVDPDPDHRLRLHPLHGAADPRPGAFAAGEGVRGGCPGAGHGAGAHDVLGDPAEPGLTIVVFFPIMVANAILLEAALSFLGAGVQPPEPSWGNMIDQGVDKIVTAPHQAIVPGLMLVMTVLSLNVFGDGVRDAFDPRAKVRVEH